MTQKIIKAIYKKPVTYKLIRDGYKTITNSFTPDNDTPSTMTLDTPSEVYSSNLQYTVDTSLDGEPILKFDSFVSPDNETVESAQYCYAPKGRDYNCEVWIQELKTYDNFTAVGSINLDENTGLVTNFSGDNYIQIPNSFNSDDVTEAQVCFITGSDVTSTQPFFLSSKSDDTSSFVISNGTLYFVHKQGGSYGDYQSLGLSVSENIKYWFKFTQNSNVIASYLSTDGVNFTQGNSVSRSRTFTTLIGSGVNNDESTTYFKGSLYLSDMYIKINNQTWWTPYTTYSGWKEVQIPGMLDESVTTDNWNQSQNYKLYQLKQQDNSNDLQLTSDSITDEGQKYNQYIDQITIPARDYKWYYHHNVETGVYDNYNIIGSPTIDTTTGVASGFSTTSYLNLPEAFNPADNQWEAKFKITTGSDVSTDQEIFRTCISAPSHEGRYGIGVMIYNSGKFDFFVSSNGSSWLFDLPGTYTVLPNTTYWVKIGWNGTDYYLEYSLDNITYTRDITYASTSGTYNGLTLSQIGIYSYSGAYHHPWLGTIDLSECEIKMNGNLWWSPMSTEDKWLANKSIYDYSATGLYADTLDFTKSYIGVNNSEYHKYLNPKVCLMPIDGGETTSEHSLNCNKVGNINFDKNTCIVNNFGTNDYLTKTVQLSNNWEIYCKFTTPVTTVTNGQKILSIGHQSTEYKYLLLTLANNGTDIYVKTSNNGSSHVIDSGTNAPYPIQKNTTYYAKIGSNGLQTYFYLSTSGYDNMTQIIAANNPTSIPLTDLYIGSDPYFTTKGAFRGSIDLSETYIKVNDQLWWTAVTNNIKHNQYLIPTVKTINGTSFGNIVFDDETGIVSGFSSSNYLTITSSDLTAVSRWRVYSKIYITTLDKYQFWFYRPIAIGLDSTNHMHIWGLSFGDIASSFTFSANTWYWVLFEFTGSAYKGYYKTAETDEWTEIINIASTDKITSTDTGTYIGLNPNNTSEYFYGSIDLTEERLEIGSQDSTDIWTTVWTGATSKLSSISGCLYNYTDDGQQHSFDVYYDSNYTQPILVESGEIYSQGTKVDTITIPEHKLWTYENGGVWTERESYTPALTSDVIVNLTGTPSYFEEFIIDDNTYTLSDFVDDTLRITLTANQTYTWRATAKSGYEVSPSSGSFSLDDDVTINIQCQEYQFFG